jgi:hypothetical protein
MSNINDSISPDAYGCWIDCGNQSGNTLSYRIIKLAISYGYDVDEVQLEKDMAEYDDLSLEDQADVSEGLWEESSLALDWMNSQIEDKVFYFYVDDNCLFLTWDDETGTEYNV